MSLKASVLKSNENQKKAIAKDTQAILAQIDDELKAAHEQGRHTASVSVPTIFSIPYMSNADTQRIVYYKILISLIDRGYTVDITLGKDSSVFNVTWLNEDEMKEIAEQNTLLAKYTKKTGKDIKL
jgi:hypothetical protein